MKLRKTIKNIIREYFSKNKILFENKNIDQILDKINRNGKQSLSYDELNYLKQYSENNVDLELEKWIFSDDDETFNENGEKLLFDEFIEHEDIFHNHYKLIRVISKHLNKKPFTNNSDWGSGYVWSIKSNDNYIGTFLFLGDDELIVIKRSLIGDEYIDKEIKNIRNSKDLYNFFIHLTFT